MAARKKIKVKTEEKEKGGGGGGVEGGNQSLHFTFFGEPYKFNGSDGSVWGWTPATILPLTPSGSLRCS